MNDGAAYTGKDQRCTIRTFEHDDFGRMVKDRVTTDGDAKVDVSVRSILTDYDDRGRVAQVSSYSQADPTVGTDTPVNEVVYAFDDGSPRRAWQSRSVGTAGAQSSTAVELQRKPRRGLHVATSWQEHAGAAIVLVVQPLLRNSFPALARSDYSDSLSGFVNIYW